MENELLKITNDISKSTKEQNAKLLMKVFRAVSPKFYKGLSVENLQLELSGILILIADIDNLTLAEMCKRAIKNYGIIRSEDSKNHFDINYLMQFYKDSFDYVHSINVPLSKKATLLEEYYDDVTHIKYQKWNDKGKEVETASFVKNFEIGHKYSLKDFEMMYTDLDDITF